MIANIFGGIIGMLLYTLIKARKNLHKEKFDLKILVKDNLEAWIISLGIIVICALILQFDPTAADYFLEIVGVKMEGSFRGFLVLGTFLSFSSKEATKHD